MKSFKQFLGLVLIVCLVVLTAGCKASQEADEPVETQQATMTVKDGDVIGEGEKQFTLEITDSEKNTISATVNTDEATVGQALLKLGIIAGEDGPYGMYIKMVNGITADFDKDKTYWGFYVNGEYGMTGIDLTEIENGAVYGLKVEK